MLGGVLSRVDERGLTPAVGVLLVAALVLVLAATAGGLFLAFAGDGDDPPPTVSFDFSMSELALDETDPPDASPGADSELTITVEAGETFNPENLQLVFDTEPIDNRDGRIAGVDTAPKSGDTLDNISGVDDEIGDRISGGERIAVPFNGDNTVQLVWAPDDETSVVLDEFVGSGGAEPKLTVEPADSTAFAETTHNLTLENINYGVPGTDGDELDTLTVAYPESASFDGLDNENSTVTMTRTLSGGPDRSEITVNSGSYSGSEATFDLSGFFDTDVAGPIDIEIDGIQNPGEGVDDVSVTLDGDAGEQTLTTDIAVGAPQNVLTVEPNSPNEDATHTWSFNDVDFDGEVDEITLDYEGSGVSFDGLDEDDVTVEITREDEEEPTDISVNTDDYSGEGATFELSGIFNTDIDGKVNVIVDGIKNPETAGTYEPTITFDGADDTREITGEFSLT